MTRTITTAFNATHERNEYPQYLPANATEFRVTRYINATHGRQPSYEVLFTAATFADAAAYVDAMILAQDEGVAVHARRTPKHAWRLVLEVLVPYGC